MKDEKYIFTFWEPAESVPGYLRLCMKTWEKFLPDYKIVLLNYKNLHEYLPRKIIDKIVYKNMTFMLQTDCIRAVLLRMYGGIWMDADTIIANESIRNYLTLRQNFIIIGTHLAFLKVAGKSKIISAWAKEVVKRVAIYKFVYKNKKFFDKFFKNICRKVFRWDYFGNDIINPLIMNAKHKDCYSVNRDIANALPESYGGRVAAPEKLYRDFYFKKKDYKEVLNKSSGIILLHNSWTPEEFKKMSEEEFLKSDVTLAKILKEILEPNSEKAL